jgi:hypothetical protein
MLADSGIFPIDILRQAIGKFYKGEFCTARREFSRSCTHPRDFEFRWLGFLEALSPQGLAQSHERGNGRYHSCLPIMILRIDKLFYTCLRTLIQQL